MSAWDVPPSFKPFSRNLEVKVMKVRMLAIIGILALAAWLPIQAEQAAQAPAVTGPSADTNKSAAKHDCCCAAKSQTGQDPAANHDSHGAACCHGKGADAAKAGCCEGKTANNMPCCTKAEKADQVALQCCKGMKEGQCPAKDAKSCCGHERERWKRVLCWNDRTMPRSRQRQVV